MVTAPPPRGANPFDDSGVRADTGAVHLADFKAPQFIAVSATPLPRNPNGKVLKAPLRETSFGAPLFG